MSGSDSDGNAVSKELAVVDVILLTHEYPEVSHLF